MSEDQQTSMRRRDLLALIGAASGGATMYEAMTTLGFAAELSYTGPIRLDGDPKGASVVILGAGLAGLVAAIELRARGLSRAGAGERGARRRALLDDPRRRSHRRDRRTEPDLRVRPGPVFQPRAVAHSSSPQGDPGLLQALRRRARALHPGQPQRLCACAERVRRQAAAVPPRAVGFQRLGRRAARQGDKPEQARRSGHHGRQAAPARSAPIVGRARRQLSLREGRVLERAARLRQGSRRRPSGAPVYSQPIGLVRRAASRPVAGFRLARRIQLSDDHVPADRRHGHDRARARARSRWRHPLRLQGHRGEAGCNGRHGGVRGCAQTRAAARPHAPIGACARSRFRCCRRSR